MPPTVEDIHDTEEEKQQEQDESVNELSSPEVVQQQKQSSNPSENTEERQKSSSSRPKTAASTRSRTEYEDDNNDNEESKASRASSSASSDNTSDLLRSDNDNSPNISDNELYNEEEEAPIETPMKSDRITSNLSNAMNIIDQENISPLGIDKFQQQNVKGEYDTSQVIQLKESFQPIINEAASYGHLDIVRKLIEVVLFKFIFLYFLFHSIVRTKCSYTKSITTDTIT
jgi:hypothetical protein